MILLAANESCHGFSYAFRVVLEVNRMHTYLCHFLVLVFERKAVEEWNHCKNSTTTTTKNLKILIRNSWLQQVVLSLCKQHPATSDCSVCWCIQFSGKVLNIYSNQKNTRCDSIRNELLCVLWISMDNISVYVSLSLWNQRDLKVLLLHWIMLKRR